MHRRRLVGINLVLSTISVVWILAAGGTFIVSRLEDPYLLTRFVLHACPAGPIVGGAAVVGLLISSRLWHSGNGRRWIFVAMALHLLGLIAACLVFLGAVVAV
jgi:hypothetical protein